MTVVQNLFTNACKAGEQANGGSSSVTLTFHLDSLDNAPVASVALPPTGGWSTLKSVTVRFNGLVSATRRRLGSLSVTWGGMRR